MCFGCIYIVSYLWNYWDFIMVTPFKKHRSIGIFTSYVKQYMYFQVIYRQNQNRFFLTFFSFLLWTMMWNICINQAAKGQQWFHEQKWCGFFFFFFRTNLELELVHRGGNLCSGGASAAAKRSCLSKSLHADSMDECLPFQSTIGFYFFSNILWRSICQCSFPIDYSCFDNLSKDSNMCSSDQ